MNVAISFMSRLGERSSGPGGEEPLDHDGETGQDVGHEAVR
jgi:hypothetical protein